MQRTNRLQTLFFLSLLLAAVSLTPGCTALPMRSQQVWRSATNHAYPSEAIGSEAFEAALDCYTESAAHDGISAKLLQNGDEAYPVMLELIASAKTRISFETYIIEKDETTDVFFAALRDAAARGVEVRFLADAVGFHRGMLAHLDELNKTGVQARIFNPLFLSWTILRGNNRDHRKILVVDGQHAVLGGINLSDVQRGDGVSGWRDTALLVSGRTAADAEQVFAETWEQAGRAWLGRSLPLTILNPPKRLLDAPFQALWRQTCVYVPFLPPAHGMTEPGRCGLDPDTYDTHNASVRVVSSSPDKRNSPTYDMAILGVLGARERIDIACAYFVPPLNLKRALLAAAARGVQVRLLLPGVTDVKWVREIGMKSYGELLAAGARIYEWPHVILHAKTMAVDGKWLVVGSANMDSRSYFLNYEACLVASDQALAEKAHAQFEADLLHAPELTLEEWLARSTRQKALETLLTPVAGQY